MNKNIKLIAVSFLLGAFAQAQDMSGKEKKALTAYEGFSFDKSIEKYEELGVISIDQKRNLANAYWKTDQQEQAREIYAEIVITDGCTADDLYNYASLLRETEEYQKSDEWMQKFAEINVSDTRGKAYSAMPGAYEQLQKDKGQFAIKNLDINSEQQDFGAVYYKNQVVFASSREGTKSIYRRWNWNGLPFLDTYLGDIVAYDITNLQHFRKEINKKFHEGPVAFNVEGDMMIFTKNNYKEKTEDGVTKLMLFKSQMIEGEWSKEVSLPFNSPDYSVGHASISKDGKTLYFASDMPGGIGGSDIYKATINDDGTFGEAVNMGEDVNTEGNEMFPFIHLSNEMLFYSSDGKVGLGGLDVFVAQINEDQSIGKVMNLGVPLNSNLDDFSFTLSKDGVNGYFSSNRDGGKGSDDIYAFQLLKPFQFGKIIKGIAKDKEGNILAGVTIDLISSNGEKVETVTTSENGEYSFLVEADKKWKLEGVKEKYFPGENIASTATEEDVIIADVELERDPGLSLYALITDKETGSPIDSVHVFLTDNMTGTTEEYWTTETGDILKLLKEKKLNDRGSYNLALEASGYLGKTVTYNTAFDKEGKYEVHSILDLTLEPIRVGGDLSKIIDINPIYFDLGKHKIRPDAALELDKIVKVMNENPNMVIELGSHTDSRGSDKSNEALSDRRAKASAAYISERISNPDRIYGKGYGEYKPNTIPIDDGTEKLLTEDYINSFKSSDRERYEELHQSNRRTEFIIIKM